MATDMKLYRKENYELLLDFLKENESVCKKLKSELAKIGQTVEQLQGRASVKWLFIDTFLWTDKNWKYWDEVQWQWTCYWNRRKANKKC